MLVALVPLMSDVGPSWFRAIAAINVALMAVVTKLVILTSLVSSLFFILYDQFYRALL